MGITWTEDLRRAIRIDSSTVASLADKYLASSERTFVKRGRTTGHVAKIRRLCELLEESGLAELRVDQFGPRALKHFQAFLAAMPSSNGARSESGQAVSRLARRSVNELVRLAVAMFRWGVSEEMVSEPRYRALLSVEALRAGRSSGPVLLREGRGVTVVDRAVVDATLALCTETIADMARLQLLGAMSPIEVCAMRARDVTFARECGDGLAVYRVDPGATKMHHLDRARKAMAAGKSVQVQSVDERDHMKAVATLWFQKHRPEVAPSADAAALAAVDEPLKRVFDATAKAAARNTYVSSLKAARAALLKLRASLPATPVAPAPIAPTTDAPPSFAPLASDPRMQAIMERRWSECVLCLNGGAYLAAVVMMGGLLESLFVSKQNRLTDKTPLIGATRAPQHKGKTLPLQEWTLNHYIEVGNELGWIGETAKRVSGVLRDYRNFVHPQAEYAQQITLIEQDARLLWDIAKSLTRELLT